ncbi:hypothetical protein BH20BAC1_BH20BAC1_04960 [soil metagenome]
MASYQLSTIHNFNDQINRLMYHKLLFILFFYFALGLEAFSQHADTLMHKLDSLNERSDTTGVQVNNIAPTAYNENTRISFKNYFVLLGSDV